MFFCLIKLILLFRVTSGRNPHLNSYILVIAIMTFYNNNVSKLYIAIMNQNVLHNISSHLWSLTVQQTKSFKSLEQVRDDLPYPSVKFPKD